MFKDYFLLGVEHILSLNALDHLLFLVALTAVSTLKNWRQLLVLITAFTIGHCLTLGFGTYNLIKIKSNTIEFLIPVTIIGTALYNIIQFFKQNTTLGLNYWIALFFGCIHGMGFSNGLKSMLSKSQSIFTPLLAFNLGIELAQLIVVIAILLIGFLVMKKLPQKYWVLTLSYGCLILACLMVWKSLK